jgi:uncharacterized OB-fold protein
VADTVSDAASDAVPFVDYLVLGDDPHLTAHQCRSCDARYFDRRNACARCFGTDFTTVDVPTEAEVVAFTIVSMAAPGVPVPFVAATVDCGGTWVSGNLADVPPDDEHVTVGMKVRLVTVPIGKDAAGTEAVAYAFAPVA